MQGMSLKMWVLFLILHLLRRKHSSMPGKSKTLHHINSCFYTCQTSTINHLKWMNGLNINFIHASKCDHLIIILTSILFAQARSQTISSISTFRSTVFLLRLLSNQISNHTYIQVYKKDHWTTFASNHNQVFHQSEDSCNSEGTCGILCCILCTYLLHLFVFS